MIYKEYHSSSSVFLGFLVSVCFDRCLCFPAPCLCLADLGKWNFFRFKHLPNSPGYSNHVFEASVVVSTTRRWNSQLTYTQSQQQLHPDNSAIFHLFQLLRASPFSRSHFSPCSSYSLPSIHLTACVNN